jgi:hypothetical protein
VLDKMPTASDKKKFCHKEYIECSFKDWAVTPEDVFGYAKGSVSEVVGAGLVWVGSNKACKTSWLSAWLGENFGEAGSGLQSIRAPASQHSTVKRHQHSVLYCLCWLAAADANTWQYDSVQQHVAGLPAYLIAAFTCCVLPSSL